MRKGSAKTTFAGRGWVHVVVPCALLALVGVLAVLQYRWVGQFSDAERQRMRASAQERADRFAEEFDSVLTGLFFAFSQPINTATASPDYPSICAQEYTRWAAANPHARLVRALFLARTAPPDAPLLKLSPGGKFEPGAWPAELDAVKSVMAPAGALGPPAGLFGMVAPAVPALLVPLTRLHVADLASQDPGRLRILNIVGGGDGALIVQLDRDYIRREWLPALARRYFQGPDGFDFNLAIADSTASRSLVYVSDPAHVAGAFAKPDVKASLFRIRLDQAPKFVPARPSGESRPPSDKVRFTIATRHETTVMTAGPRNTEWELLLTHRAGSLDAAVAQSRHRNLGISFGILGVLAVSLALIVLSARRASMLARQQIEFVAGVSHELRTPLTVIRSAGENLSDGVIHDAAHVRRYGKLIADEGRRLTELVEQVMSFAGFESGREMEQRDDIEVGDLLDGAIIRANPMLAQHGFTVDRRVAPALPRIRVNVAALTRAVENLIANAVKYSGTSRWIGLTAEASAVRGGCEVRITVEDRGVGIQPDEQRHVFEPFYRGRDVVASTIRGSGLGLSLARRIVEAHGGSISVRSAPGQGSAFTVHVPCAETGQPT